MTPQERQEILGRLAASEVASLKAMEIDAQSTKIEFDAWLKVINVLSIPAANAAAVVDTLIEHLQDSDLTINFKADRFFGTMPSGSFGNTFQQGNSPSGYLQTRDRVEEKLFDYSGTSGRTGPLSVLARIKVFGSRTNSSNTDNVFFKSAMRPKYGALNYTGNTNGAASFYGRSYMLLKEYVKHNSTFTAKDSFGYGSDPDAGNRTANYHNLGRLIVNMNNDMLARLYNAATGANLPVTANSGALNYLEAQIHASIEFNRDIRTVCIANSELGGANSRQIRENILKFGRKNSVQVRFI